MEYFYRRGSQGNKVACAYCRNPDFPNHRNGYVMLYADGARVLIGKDCGAEHFGQREFRRMMENIKAQNDRRSLLLRRTACIEAMPRLVSTFEHFLSGSLVTTYRSLQRQMRDGFPRISSALNHAVAAYGGELHHFVPVPDQDAMSAREEKREREAKSAGRPYVPDRTPIWKEEERRFGTIRFGDFFRDTEGASAVLLRLAGRLRDLQIKLPSLSSTMDLQRFFRELRDTIRDIEAQLDRIDRIPVSLSAENLKLIADWARTMDLPGKYASGPNHLVHDGADGNSCRLDVPLSLSKADRGFIKHFEDRLAQ